MAMDMSFMGLSSAATRLELSAPQRLQRWMIAHSPFFLTQTPTGSAVGSPVAGLDVYVQAGKAVGAVVAVVAAGPLRCAESAADLAGEGVIAGMGLVVAFFKSLPLVFAVHGVSS